MNATTSIKAAIALSAGALIALGAPLAASAHVTIDPGSAAAGSYAVITVKVPNESATAKTSKLTLTLPAETPFSSVRYVPVAGWSAELTRETLPAPVTVGDREITEAVTSITWTASAGSEIGDGQLQQFAVSVGPVPDVGSIVLEAEQTYTDGEVVNWSDTGESAEHPAPILYVNDDVVDAHGASVTVGEEVHASGVETDGTDDILARVLGIAGLLVGAAGVVIGVTARRKAVK